MAATPTDDRLFRAAFQGTLDALVLTADDGTCVDANEAARELVDSTNSVLVGRSIDELLFEDTGCDSDWNDVLEKLTTSDILEIPAADGTLQTAKVVTRANVCPGVHLVGVASETANNQLDITRRVELRSKVFEASPFAVVLFDSSGVVVDANHRIESVLGVDRQAILGRTISNSHWRAFTDGGVSLPPEEHPVSTVLETAEPVFEFEHRFEGTNGEFGWVSVDAIPIRADADDVDGVVAVLTDVTERRELRRLLEQQNDRLETYSSTVSHDLRSPLSVASGWLDVAIEEDSTAPLEKVRDAHGRMSDFITDFRLLGRVAQIVERTSQLELPEVVELAWSNVEPTDGSLDLEDQLDPIEADRTRLLLLFEHLFRNSLEHAGPDVTVSVGQLVSGFYVEDDGPGIPPDQRDAVFEFGYSSTAHGTGIGLTMVEAVAEAHGWETELTDSDADGVRFEFVPRWHPDRDTEA